MDTSKTVKGKIMRGFEFSLPMSLLKARESVMKKFMPHLRKHDLSSPQWCVLRILYVENNVSMSNLSIRCNLLIPSLSRIVRDLEKRQLLSRKTSTKDKRLSIISLSLNGKHLVEEIAPESEKNHRHIGEIIGDEELATLTALLDTLVDKLNASDDV